MLLNYIYLIVAVVFEVIATTRAEADGRGSPGCCRPWFRSAVMRSPSISCRCRLRTMPVGVVYALGAAPASSSSLLSDGCGSARLSTCRRWPAWG